MAHDLIWDHYQNDEPGVFAANVPRLRYLAGRLGEAKRVLDIGVGDGTLLSLAAGRGCECFAVDPSERSIERLRATQALGERAQVAGAEALPFPDAQFDIVVISEVIEHLAPEIATAAVAEIHRVLRNGGRIIGTVPAEEDMAEHMVVCPCCGTRFHRWGHLQRFDETALRRLIEAKFGEVAITRKLFLALQPLNWKGRAAGLLRLAFAAAGVFGRYSTFVFEGVKR